MVLKTQQMGVCKEILEFKIMRKMKIEHTYAIVNDFEPCHPVSNDSSQLLRWPEPGSLLLPTCLRKTVGDFILSLIFCTFCE